MDIIDSIKDLAELIRHKQTVLKFYGRVPDDQVLEKGFAPDPFEPDEAYFEISLAEMFLSDHREYWRKFVPLGLVLSDFTYDYEKQSIPFFVGQQRLKGLERYLEGEYVQYLNTSIVGPVPYVGDNVGLLVALFRVQTDDLAENLFNCLETLVKAFDVSQISTYLEIARPLKEGLTGLLGMSQVEYRLGSRDEYSSKPNDFRRFRKGYLAYVNCPETGISDQQLWVKDGRLWRGEGKETLQPFRTHDYCLVRIEHHPRRTDTTTLPFFKLWREVEGSTAARELKRARSKFNEFIQKLAVSPDLIKGQRSELELAYTGNYVSLVERGKGTPAHKGSADAYPEAAVQQIANRAENAGFSKETVQGLWDLSMKWGSIPYLDPARRREDFQVDDDILAAQLKAIGQVSQVAKTDPQKLADAIVLASLVD